MNLASKIWFVGLLVLATFIQPVSPSQAGTFYDPFNDNFLNLGAWSYEIWGQGPTVAEVNNRLEITFPATSTGDLGVGLYPRFTVKGDFDEQVDFNLLNWPAGNGIGIQLSAPTQFNISRRSYGADEGGPKEVYFVYCLGAVLATVNTTDTSGKLRLKRTGNTIEGFYWQNNAWQSLASYTHPDLGAEGEVGFGAGSTIPSHFIGQLVKIGFNNYRLTNQYICNALSFLPLFLE